jgi:hypothetical protein
MVDEADQPIGYQPSQHWSRGKLKLPAERAQEVDEGVNADRAVSHDDPVALRCRAGRKVARGDRVGHDPSGKV